MEQPLRDKVTCEKGRNKRDCVDRMKAENSICENQDQDIKGRKPSVVDRMDSRIFMATD